MGVLVGSLVAFAILQTIDIQAVFPYLVSSELSLFL